MRWGDSKLKAGSGKRQMNNSHNGFYDLEVGSSSTVNRWTCDSSQSSRHGMGIHGMDRQSNTRHEMGRHRVGGQARDGQARGG